MPPLEIHTCCSSMTPGGCPVGKGGPRPLSPATRQPQALECWAAMLGAHADTRHNTGSVKGLINFLFQVGGDNEF